MQISNEMVRLHPALQTSESGGTWKGNEKNIEAGAFKIGSCSGSKKLRDSELVPSPLCASSSMSNGTSG